MRDRSFRDVRQAHQPIAPAHDRRHDGAPDQRRMKRDYVRQCEEVRSLPRPVAGHGDERGPSPLSTAYGAAAGQRWNINAAIAALRFFFTVTLEQPDLVRPLRTVNKPRRAPVVLSQEEVARLLEAAPEPQVQGRAQRRLRRRPAGVRGREPEGVRHRQPAHDASGRAGQGAAGSLCDALAATARTVARMVAARRGRRSGCFPARTRSIR